MRRAKMPLSKVTVLRVPKQKAPQKYSLVSRVYALGRRKHFQRKAAGRCEYQTAVEEGRPYIMSANLFLWIKQTFGS